MTDARLSAIVVDDEPLARRELKALLAAHQDLEIVGEAEDVDTAAALISRVSPDIVFLDIQLSGATGFDLLARVPARFEVVFVTAYEQHALRAFDVNALGYLLKPVSRERLAEVVARLVTRLHGARADESRDDRGVGLRDGGLPRASFTVPFGRNNRELPSPYRWAHLDRRVRLARDVAAAVVR